MSKEKENESYARREVHDNQSNDMMKNGTPGSAAVQPGAVHQPVTYPAQSQPAGIYPGLTQPAAGYGEPSAPPAAAYPGQTYNTVTAEVPAPVGNPIFTTGVWNSVMNGKKSVVEAYLLWVILGFLGAHHFYLRRPGFGVIYFFTFGLLGCGYVIDMFRMPYLVSQANKEVGRNVQARNRKNIGDAYTLWFPCGLIGLHHYYLRNYGQGVLYSFTFGVLGIGWLIDLIRIPSMVKHTNKTTTSTDLEKSVGTAYVFSLTPLGILGVQHFYLNRPIIGLIYLLTFGVFGVGWIVDWFRVPILVKRANKEIHEGPDDVKHLDDAYVLWFPLIGILGMHQFYLRRPLWGFVYLFSFGLFGLGWIVDGFRMACLVKDCNKREKERQKLPVFQTTNGAVLYQTNTGKTHVGHVTTGTGSQPSTSQVPDAQPSQVPQAGYQATGGASNPSFYPLQNPPAYDYQGTRQVPTYMEQPPPYSPVAHTNTSGTEKVGKS